MSPGAAVLFRGFRCNQLPKFGSRSFAAIQPPSQATQVGRQGPESVQPRPQLHVFIRQPFTQTRGADEQVILEGAMSELRSLQTTANINLNFLVRPEAQNAETFKRNFEQDTGLKFTPKNFRDYRLAKLQAADAFIFLRTGLSESGAFELAVNAYGRKIPTLMAIWDKTPIKTTLLRELEDTLPIDYVHFGNPRELHSILRDFFERHFKMISFAQSPRQ